MSKNKILQVAPCGTVLIASVSFTSNLAVFVHKFDEQKINGKKKLEVP